MLVNGERKMPKDDAQPRIIFFQQFLSQTRRNCRRAGTENRQTLPASPGHRDCHECASIGVAICRESLVFGNSLKLRMLCTIEHRAAPKSDQCDTNDDYKRQVAFHAEQKRRIFDAGSAPSSASRVKINFVFRIVDHPDAARI